MLDTVCGLTADKFKRRRAHNGRNASAPAHISRE